MMTPLLDARRWTVRLDSGSGRWAGGSGPAQLSGLVVGERVRSGAEQLAAVGVEEHQGGVLDADADPAPAEDFRGEDGPLP